MESLIIGIVTLGCKVNQCESAAIAAALQEKNLYASEGLGPADVYILNTCSVTAEADRKSRQYITKMIKQNKDCKIIVIGCSSQNDADKFKNPNVIAIGGTVDKTRFVYKIIDCLLDNNEYSITSDRVFYRKNSQKTEEYVGFCEKNSAKSNKTRAFIKIQDGCNRFCSYCIIPYLRGRSKSRTINDIKQECERTDSMEIVLTGIDISAYGYDLGKRPVDLLYALSDIKARKRLGSFECEMIDDEFLSAMKSGGFCSHFHMSLQSGSDAVLKSMNRHYTADFYYEKVQLIRKHFPLAGITTDVIVGFPTETNENFDETCEFVKRCEFSDIHVFPYSSRTGTVAAKKYAALPKGLINDRKKVLLDIKKSLHDDFLQKNLGTISDVYVEDRENGFNVGYTPNYIKVYSDAPCGTIAPMQLDKPYGDGIIGSIEH